MAEFESSLPPRAYEMQRDHQDIELGESALPPLLPEDQTYTMFFVRMSEDQKAWEKDRVYLYFEIVDGPHAGEQIYLPATKLNRYGPSSSIGKLWLTLLGGPPKSRAKFHTKLLLNKLFKVKVRTSKFPPSKHGEKRKDRVPKPRCQWFSVIEEVLSVEVGS